MNLEPTAEFAQSQAGQRFLPRDRESFLDAQARNRRATWRLSVLCTLAAAVMGIPLALIITPLLYAVALLIADIVNLFSPLPPAFWQMADQVARLGFIAVGWVLDHKPADPRSMALGAVVMLLPGILLSLSLWLGIDLLFRRSGVGGALRALQAREPNQADLKELRLADVVQEMSIAAGLPAPRVMLIDAPGANAAAIGTSPADARIVVSRCLLDDLNRDELEGALAHLIASVGNGDLRIAFRITAVFQAHGLLLAILNSPFGSQSRRLLWRMVRSSWGGAATGGQAQEAAAVADMLARNVALDTDDIDRFFEPGGKHSRLRSIRNFIFFPIFFTNTAIKLALWIFSSAVLGPSVSLLWHTRQYLADAAAVQLTRNPDGLAAALQKLNDDPGEIPGGNWASHLFLVSPKPGNRASSFTVQQKQMLARAWAASEPAPAAADATAAPADFETVSAQFPALLRAAFSGDEQAMARIHSLYQRVATADPAFAAQIPSPDDLIAARRGDAAALSRLLAERRRPATQKTPPQDDGGSSGIDSLSLMGFHPSLKRRLKRLAGMGAHLQAGAAQPRAWIVVFVITVIFAPLFLLIAALLLLLIAVMTVASLGFLMVWMAVIHKLFALIAYH